MPLAALSIAARAPLAVSAVVLAETSASKTAEAAKLAALSARADVADATSESAMADVEEADSHERYKDASDRAAGRSPRS